MLRAIALKQSILLTNHLSTSAEIIMLRAIALKLAGAAALMSSIVAEIIMLRAIALKRRYYLRWSPQDGGRDHNATSYSTETLMTILHNLLLMRRDHNATSYSTETYLETFFFFVPNRQRS